MYKTSLLNNYLRDLIKDFTTYTELNYKRMVELIIYNF